MRKSFWLFSIVLVLSVTSQAQLKFLKAIGTSANESGSDIVELSNGDFVIAGLRTVAGNQDAYIVRTDYTGAVIWAKSYGGSSNEQFERIIQTQDGGFLAIGNCQSYTTFTGKRSVYVVKTTSSGNLEWSRVFTSLTKRNNSNGVSNEYGMSVVQLPDGTYVIGGQMGQEVSNSANSTVLFLDEDGGVLNYIKDDTKVQYTSFGNSNGSLGVYTYQLPDGGFIITGSTHEVDLLTGDTFDGTVTRVDKDMNIIWSRNIGNRYNEGIWDMEPLPRDEFFLSGNCGYPNFGYVANKAYYSRVNDLGELQWAAVLLSPGFNAYYSVSTVRVGNDYVTALWDQNDGNSNGYLVKFNEGGVIWAKRFGGAGTDRTFQLIKTSDGGFAVIGVTNSIGAGGDDIFLVKTDADGNSGCTTQNVTFTLQPLAVLTADRPTVYTKVVNPLTVTVGVNPVPFDDAPLGRILTGSSIDASCAGSDGTATVTVTNSQGPATYQWSTTPVQTTETATGLASGTYQVVVRDGSGCIDSLTVVVNKGPNLIIDITVAPDTCLQSFGAATASVPGYSGPATYNWTTTPAQSTANATGLMAGQNYTLTVTLPGGCSADSTFTVSNVNALNLGLQSSVPVSCNGFSDGSITVSVPGDPSDYAYSWNTTPVQTTQTASGLAPGSYTVTVTKEGLCATSFTYDLINPPPMVVDMGFGEEHCGQGDGFITLDVSGGSGQYTYSWNTTPVQTTDDIFNLSAGGYDCVITDGFGCAFGVYSGVLAASLPVVATVNKTNVQCEGGNNGSITIAASGGGTLTYSWDTNPVQTTTTISNLPKGTYTCTITDGFGCSLDTAIVLTEMFPIPVFTLGADTAICQGDSVRLAPTVVSALNTHLWNTGATTTFIYAKQQGVYWLEVTRNGCSYRDSIFVRADQAPALDLGPDSTYCGTVSATFNVSVTGNGTYFWNDGSAATSRTFTQAGQYWVRITRDRCVVADTVNLSVQAPLSVNLPITITSCTGQTEELTPTLTNAANPQYLWSTGADTPTLIVSAAGRYVVVVREGSCIASDTCDVIFNLTPAVNLGPDRTLCVGQNTVLNCGNPAYSKRWSTGDTTIAITVTQTGIYSIRVVNQNCETRDTVNVTFNPVPVFSLGNDTTVCPGEPVTIGQQLPNATYAWNTGETTPFITVDSTGRYRLTISLNGCNHADEERLMNFNIPVIQAIDTAICKFDSLTISANCIGCTYLWDDGTTSNSLRVGAPSVHQVLITDVNSCIQDKEFTVEVDNSDICQWTVYAPNAFTPDEDGYNEVFQLESYGVQEINLTIWDRWGELIYSEISRQPHWNGFYKGRLCKVDTYVWRARVQPVGEAKDHLLVGKVTLVR